MQYNERSLSIILIGAHNLCENGMEMYFSIDLYIIVGMCTGMCILFRYERPILLSREPDASDAEVTVATQLQKELSTIVNEFILKRGNILNAQHLPPKLVQVIACRLSPVQDEIYEMLLNSKEVRHIRDGKQTNTLNTIRQMINICRFA